MNRIEEKLNHNKTKALITYITAGLPDLETTKKLVEYLESKPEVEWVRHPFAKGNPYKELADKYFPKGAGAVFSFGFGGNFES